MNAQQTNSTTNEPGTVPMWLAILLVPVLGIGGAYAMAMVAWLGSVVPLP